MNSYLYPVSFKKYSLTLIYGFFFVAIIAWGLEFYFETLYGDLTRVGYFSERDFGWQTLELPEQRKDYPSLVIPVEHFKDYVLAEADIVVIGDSFSIDRVWQTKLIADGLKVITLSWTDLKATESLRSDLGDSLRAQGFKGRYVIIESVERRFQERMESLSKERNAIAKHTIKINSSLPIYSPTRSLLSMTEPNGAGWNLKTLVNKIRLSGNLYDGYLQSGLTRAINFEGCAFFSHKLCNVALFFKGDFDKKTFSAIDNVLTVNKNLQQVGIQAIWLVIPDKSTVYLGYGKYNSHPYTNSWQLLAQYPELIAPNLGESFIQKSRIIKDFYLPNDGHLSTIGYLYLGDIVRDGLQ